MQKVTGIGGFFFRAKDPEALAHWYHDNLGIPEAPQAEGDPSWWQQAGTTVFTPMTYAIDQFGDPQRDWALNLRVDDLPAMIEQLRAAGIEVTDAELYSIGGFASLRDPEGNPIQLWQPPNDDAPHH